MTSNSTAAGNVLSAPSLSKTMAGSLPATASPQLKNAYDAVALVAHAGMLAVGFRLVGLGEDHKIEAESTRDEPQELPSEWNANAGSYAFRYAHSQSSMEFLLKVNRMGNKAVVMGMGLGDDRTCTFDIVVQDYISAGNLPATPKPGGASLEQSTQSIIDIFISVGRVSDIGNLLRINIIQKLTPSLQKEGYEESREANTSSSSNTTSQQPRGADRPDRDPLRDDRVPNPRPFPLADPLAHPRRPMPDPMPGFEDEFETQRPLRGPMGGLGGGYPRIGDRDLYPAGLGPNDPFRGGVGPGFGGMGGGGMHPTFDDPMFAGQGPRGGGGFDPQAPPGSRYDPVGPGNRGGHPRGAGMGGRPPNPFGGFGDGDFL